MKLNNKLQLGTFFISMLMLTACGDGGTISSTPGTLQRPIARVVRPPVTLQDLAGSWSTVCKTSNRLMGYDEQDVFTFTGNRLATTKTFFLRDSSAPQTCAHSNEALIARFTANLSIGATVNLGTSSEHTKLDITRTTVILGIMTPAIQRLFVSSAHTSAQSIYNGYGLNNWTLPNWKDITNIAAARENFKIGEPELDIFRISISTINGMSSKVLQMSVRSGNVDSDGRPISLLNNVTSTLQQTMTQSSQQAGQSTGLSGSWKYPCTAARGNPFYYQLKTLTFDNNKLKTEINIYDNSSLECAGSILYQVESDADLVLGDEITFNPRHFQIGIKTTKVAIKLFQHQNSAFTLSTFNQSNFYNTRIKDPYNGYGQTNWQLNEWKDISDVPAAIAKLHIGTEVPDILQITTTTINNASRQVIKMGNYLGRFDINGRPSSLESEGALLQ